MPTWVRRLLPRRRDRTAFLGLGSNVGDRLEVIRTALTSLEAHERISVAAVSAVYETEPVVADDAPAASWDQPPYLNCAVCVTTSLRPGELLAATQAIEEAHGRDRSRELRHGPRSLDIDLLLYEDEQIDEPELSVPHPHLTDRAFVLVPLAEILPAGATLPDGTRVAARIAELAPITGVELHVRLLDGPGAQSDPLARRPRGPAGGRPHLGERQGGHAPDRRQRGQP